MGGTSSTPTVTPTPSAVNLQSIRRNKSKECIDIKQLAQDSPLTAEQVQALLVSFKKYGKEKKGSSVITRDKFKKVVAAANEIAPHAYLADPGFADGIFTLFDTDHDGKVQFHELLQGLSIICEGSVKQKAELAFLANDLDGNGYLDRKEVEAAINHTLKNSKKLIKEKVKRVLKTEGLPGAVATPVAMVTAMLHFSRVDDQEVISRLIDGMFEADEDKDGKLSKEEWVAHAEQNPMIKDFLTWSFGRGVVECEKVSDLDNMRSPECAQQ